MKCPHCGETVQVMHSEVALGDIWSHEHGACIFFSMSRNPHASGTRWAKLRSAWLTVRDNYDYDDWRRGWDAHFRGKQSLAEKLWHRFERTRLCPAS